MSFSVGIVGLPNVGKSTLFTAITKKQVDCQNYPFCTIEPNVGTVAVPDERLDQLDKLYNSAKFVPTTIEFVDIAGLVKGASTGEGLGNKFLANIREVDAIVEVVREFHNDDIIHVHGKIDPEDDIKTINLELILADLDMLNKKLETLSRQTKGSHDKELFHHLEILNQLKAHLEQEKLAIEFELLPADRKLIQHLNLLTYKPILYVYNVSEEDLTKPIPDAKQPYLTICARLESELAGLPEAEIKEYLASAGVTQTGLDRLIQEAYKQLNLITFFTAGPKEAHAWTIEQGTLAPQAAGKIHTDFEAGFVRAEVINWQNLVEAGGEFPAKEKGLMKTEGKAYIMNDGDVVHFLFNN